MAVAELIDEEVIDDALTDLPKGFELVDGELIEISKMSFISSLVATRLNTRLDNWCIEKNLGIVATAEASYSCFPHRPGTIRKPDVSVILCDPATWTWPDPHCEDVPALVVEVVSPNERVPNLDSKIDDFLMAGTQLVWVIHPLARKATVHYPDFTVKRVTESESLNGEHVLPGFAIALASILPPKPNA
jgi:Uma2 family endonuclease